MKLLTKTVGASNAFIDTKRDYFLRRECAVYVFLAILTEN